MNMKIAYAGFDLMQSALEALCRNNEVMKLFTCVVDGDFETNSGVIALARRYGFPYTTVHIPPADVDALVESGCELLVSAGYYYRIPTDSRLPMVNIHPSLLPYGRGPWPMPLAILDSLPESGVTVHKTEERFDTGDILLQERFAIAPGETLESFMEKVNSLVPAMTDALTADFQRLWDNALPQGEGVYQPEPAPEDYVLSRDSDPGYADRVLRAFYGYYTLYTDGGQLFRIKKGSLSYEKSSGKQYAVSGAFIDVIEE